MWHSKRKKMEEDVNTVVEEENPGPTWVLGSLGKLVSVAMRDMNETESASLELLLDRARKLSTDVETNRKTYNLQ